jgi:hypothetical protein
MSEPYYTVVEGPDGWSDWFHAKAFKERVACCDCDLVHDWEFCVRPDGKLYYRIRSNMRATAQRRRKRKR